MFIITKSELATEKETWLVLQELKYFCNQNSTCNIYFFLTPLVVSIKNL